ncbi:MAG: hypothetical protein AVDCRST_MAG96-3245, partial [uncultured Segetibacter sp.]
FFNKKKLIQIFEVVYIVLQKYRMLLTCLFKKIK